MLRDIDESPIMELPRNRRSFFKTGRAKITDADYRELKDCVNRMVDQDYAKSEDGSITVPGWNAQCRLTVPVDPKAFFATISSAESSPFFPVTS